MATLRTRNGTYYAEFHDANRSPSRRRLSLKTKDRRVARKLLSQLEDAYLLNEWDAFTDSVDDHFRRHEPVELSDARKQYLAAKKPVIRSSTLDRYSRILLQLEKMVGAATLLERLRTPQIDAFVRADGYARSTQRTRYSVVKAFLRWTIKADLLEDNPIEKVQMPSPGDSIPRSLSLEDLDEIAGALRTDYERKLSEGKISEGELIWHGDVWYFALYTGMRRSEIARLKWKHIDFDQRLIYILFQKNGRKQTIPLSSRAREILERASSGAPDSYVFSNPRPQSANRSPKYWCNHVSVTFAKYREEAGFGSNITFHSLRHAHCSMLAANGKSAVVIKESARHANIQTSMRYVTLANEHLKSEIDDVFD